MVDANGDGVLDRSFLGHFETFSAVLVPVLVYILGVGFLSLSLSPSLHVVVQWHSPACRVYALFILVMSLGACIHSDNDAPRQV